VGALVVHTGEEIVWLAKDAFAAPWWLAL